MKLLIRWVIVSLALFAAAWLIPGIYVEGTAWIVYAVMALILGLINATVRPLLKFLTCPLILLTLGRGWPSTGWASAFTSGALRWATSTWRHFGRPFLVLSS
jgi:hypothetical protein